MVSSIQSLEDTIETKQDLIDDNTDIQMRNLTCDGLVLGDLNVVTKLNKHSDSINTKQDIIDDNTDLNANSLSANSLELTTRNPEVVFNVNTRPSGIMTLKGEFLGNYNAGISFFTPKNVENSVVAMQINSWQSLTTVFINKHQVSETNQSGYCLVVEGKIAGTYYGTSSDDRLKHNEKDITNGLEIIRQLKPQVYQKTEKMKDADFNGDLDEPFFLEAGFIAQDVLKIEDISYSVTGGDYVDMSGNLIPETFQVNYNNIFTYAVSALQDVDKELQSEKLKTKELQSKYEDLLKRVIELE